MRNRLDEELRIVEHRRSWLGIERELIEVIRQACAVPDLSMEALDDYRWRVLGHGDYQASNILWNNDSGIIPVDWVDFGVCDARYEWAHFLNSFDGKHGAFAVDGLFHLAHEVLCPTLDPDAFRHALRIGEIMDRVIRAGSKARTAEKGADNTARVEKLCSHIHRLAMILRPLTQ